jgi:hypothetical protein
MLGRLKDWRPHRRIFLSPRRLAWRCRLAGPVTRSATPYTIITVDGGDIRQDLERIKVEPARSKHEVRGQHVDLIFVTVDVRVFLRRLLRSLIANEVW